MVTYNRLTCLTKEQYFVADMPFEGPLLKTELVRTIGIPEQGFFLEYDDSDYAQRILQHSKIVYVTNAILHRQLVKKTREIRSQVMHHIHGVCTIR